MEARGGLLLAARVVPGALRPALLRAGPCRAVRVCMPAINIDGGDSVRGCLSVRRLGCKRAGYLLPGLGKAA